MKPKLLAQNYASIGIFVMCACVLAACSTLSKSMKRSASRRAPRHREFNPRIQDYSFTRQFWVGVKQHEAIINA